MRPRRDLFLVLSVCLLGCPYVFASQDVKPKGETGKVETTRPVAASVDPRFRSPRATRADIPDRDELDGGRPAQDRRGDCLSRPLEIPPDRQKNGGRFAFELEFILRSTNIPTFVIPDVEEARSARSAKARTSGSMLYTGCPTGDRLLRGQDTPGAVENAPAPLGASGSSAETKGIGSRRRARRIPVALRNVSHIHRFV